jgi:hypothetical protein
MSFISIPFTFTNNTIAQAPQVNSNFTAVTSVVNGAIDNTNISSSAAIALSKLGLNPGSAAFNKSTTGQITWSSGLTTDTQAQVQMTTDKGLQFGPGGSTAPDIELKRSAATTLQILTPAGGAGTFDGNAGTLQNFSNITLSSGGTLNLNGGTLSGFTSAMVNGGRLYLVSGTPFSDSGSTSTLFFGPAYGNQITLYNGSSEVTQTFAQVSLSLVSLTVNSVYDVYVKSASGTTVALSTVIWTNTTTPPTRGTQDGRLTKSGDATSLLAGSIFINASNQAIDNTSTRGVSNLYNAVPRAMICADTTPTWTYGSTTPRAANANTTDGVGKVSFLQTIANGAYIADCFCAISGGSIGSYVGIGVNSNTAYSSYTSAYSAGVAVTAACSYAGSAGVGITYLQRMESTYGATITYGLNTYAAIANGLSAVINN